ncbi:MAG: hypothetical protein A2186_01720 [Candidatus Levybacteria bacterium RIFOXYA1_FULL_41_10]|nr:MAG: hypothetical protein UT87_C0005G0065 [Candidatus Levybacteria bacterium GW2011_GWC1_40_19]KKR72148.1 MAG: hypothetical protein UU15_C0034G0007 [Candidatus Levybacteria bacterium GW2011_GWC2_40_7]KKR95407.1 MAG: hypothetical protein UU45_C0001G0002 [Candidatus Levybacteria bacterium GW2011_GWA2_41_15]KKS01892.1 MAG: hypothetical protein UU52_C0005G0001 [Candidatus Levybacteria bacterium GW2011_GWB1_41_21]OGH20896.1 MAG: hypothetical protein A2695_02800 [Candidatus Levybacteria bacterium 
MSKNNKRIEFPSIYRAITDKNNAPFIVLSILLVIAVFMVGIDLDKNVSERDSKKKLYEEKSKEIKFWEEGVVRYTGFRDGYFKLALLEFQRGNFNKSREYLEKALSIDPSFEEGKSLEKILED